MSVNLNYDIKGICEFQVNVDVGTEIACKTWTKCYADAEVEVSRIALKIF